MEEFNKDFKKIRGALLAQIRNNQNISEELMRQFSENDFSLLEEHTALSKIVLDSTKALTDAYKQSIEIQKNNLNKPKEKIDIKDLLEESEESEESGND